jgi:putative ABC transport system substrate-binding protein
MRRREFITLLGGAAMAWPRGAFAQAERVRRIGVLFPMAKGDAEGQARLAAFQKGLHALGWTRDRNVQIEDRWSGGDPARARANAAELVGLKPDAIFAATSSSLAALKGETDTIPIVFAQVADPVGAGFVAALARPGGNITGFALFDFPIGAKWVELLKQIAPRVERVAIMYDPANAASKGYLPTIDAAARTFGLRALPIAVRSNDDIERGIAAFAREPNGGIIPLPGPLMVTRRYLILSLADRYRLPNVYAFRYYPVSGGLASYGVDVIDLYKRAASYVDRVLKGEKPADLPVQFADKFELVINLKTAKALGLDIPVTVLARTDEVIE